MRYFYLVIAAWLLILLQSILVFYLPFWMVPNLALIAVFWLALRRTVVEACFFALFLGVFVVYFTPSFWWAPLIYGILAAVLFWLNRHFSLSENHGPSILIYAFLIGIIFGMHFQIFHWSFSVLLFVPWFLTVFITLILVQLTQKYYEV